MQKVGDMPNTRLKAAQHLHQKQLSEEQRIRSQKTRFGGSGQPTHPIAFSDGLSPDTSPTVLEAQM